MTTSIFPETHGDVILDFRNVISDGVLRPALIVVDAEGKPKASGKLVEVRDGGGHVELFRFLINDGYGFERNGDQKVLIYPEGV